MYKSVLLEQVCPEIFYEMMLSMRSMRQQNSELTEKLWNSAFDWCQVNGHIFVQVQFVTIRLTQVYIIYKENV